MDIENRGVICYEFGFMFCLDMNVGAASPAFIQVEIFVNAVPFLWIELAGGERETSSTGFYGNIGDDCACMVGGEMVVD